MGIGELQDISCVRPWPASVHFNERRMSSDGNKHLTPSIHPAAWDWSDASIEEVTVSKWNQLGGMTLICMTPWELSLIVRDAPVAGDWYCPACHGHNNEKATSCRVCWAGTLPPSAVAWPRTVDDREVCKCWGCGITYQVDTPACHQCGYEFQLKCSCCGRRGKDGWNDKVTKGWTCSLCWKTFRQLNELMQQEMPRLWYVDGGQRWTWIVDGATCGFIEFGKSNYIITHSGKGSWWPDDADMKVSFGYPTVVWRLTRTVLGFTATPFDFREDTKRLKLSCIEGTPLYGSPSQMEI